MLPDADHPPPRVPQLPIRVGVAPAVRLDLLAPEARVGLGPSAVLRTAVPETAIDEHGEPGGSEHDVGATTYGWDWGSIHAVAETEAVQLTPNGHFSGRVSPARRAHSLCGIAR